MLRKVYTGVGLLFAVTLMSAQQSDSVRYTTTSDSVVVTADYLKVVQWNARSIPATIVAGRSATRILLNDIDANTSANSTREIYARTPGIHIWEFSGTGLQANVATRGLSAHRSSEFNVRYDGIDIASDPYGYPEAHFTPPTEVIASIDVIRGGGGIQYGPQFGGLLNYRSKPPSTEAFTPLIKITGGSYGFFDGVGLASGTIHATSYNAWMQYRRADGWRQNGGYEALSGSASVGYQLATDHEIQLRYTGAWFVEHMPNGLSDAQFATNPQLSVRPRDYFSAPRSMVDLRYHGFVSQHLELFATVSGLIGDRNSSSLTSVPTIPDSGTNPRRVNLDHFRNVISEYRMAWSSMDRAMVITGGLRLAATSTLRQQGRGPDGSSAEMSVLQVPSLDILFKTTDISVFSEAMFTFSPELSFTAGLRWQRLGSSAVGTYASAYSASTDSAFYPKGRPTSLNEQSTESIPLASFAVLIHVSPSTELFANISQAYRPLLYAQQYPYDFIPVDKSIRSSHGFVSELGFRTSPAYWLRAECTFFFLHYGDRVGVIVPTDGSSPSGLRTNTGSSDHYGAEVGLSGSIPISTSIDLQPYLTSSYTHATYVRGPVVGNDVENAPSWISRLGFTFGSSIVRIGASLSNVSSSYSDASNTPSRPDGTLGTIPAYSVIDARISYQCTQWLRVQLNANNIANAAYFTTRMTAYPGPGLLPGEGRTISLQLTYQP
ncbi:TonB-dependent receptor [soil metagenome]